MKLHKNCWYKKIESKTGHTMVVGMSGYGKGMFSEGYVTKKLMKGYKVFDMHSESRGEGMYYGLKNTDSNLTGRVKYFTNNILEAKGYDNEIIMFLGNNIKKIGILPKNIKICVFNEEWFSNEDLKNILAFNENQSSFMDGVFEIFDDRQITISQLYDFLRKAADKDSEQAKQLKQAGAHYMSINTIKRRCRSILKSGLFYNEEPDKYPYLDLKKSAEQRDMITSFSTYLIDDKYIKFVCVDLLLKKFIEFIEMRQYFNPILFYIREANDFYHWKNPAPYIVDIQDSIAKILRQGRALGGTKVDVVLDTQYIGDLPDYVYKSFNKFVVFRLPYNDAKTLLHKATIHEDYLRKITKMPVGMAMYVANGEFYYPIRVLPTLHKKAEPDFDVFKHLSNKFGIIDYNSTNFFKSDIIDYNSTNFSKLDPKNNELELGLISGSNGGEMEGRISQL